jgi:hypothetical protein
MNSGKHRDGSTRRQPGIQSNITRDVTDFTANLCAFTPTIAPEDLRHSGTSPQESHQNSDRRRLPGPIWPQKSENLTGRDRQINVRNASARTIAAAQLPCLNNLHIDLSKNLLAMFQVREL